MRAANLYFLISTVISCISIISPIEPFSAIFPLFLVLSVSLTREAIEDYVSKKDILSFKINNLLDILGILITDINLDRGGIEMMI